MVVSRTLTFDPENRTASHPYHTGLESDRGLCSSRPSRPTSSSGSLSELPRYVLHHSRHFVVYFVVVLMTCSYLQCIIAAQDLNVGCQQKDESHHKWLDDDCRRPAAV